VTPRARTLASAFAFALVPVTAHAQTTTFAVERSVTAGAPGDGVAVWRPDVADQVRDLERGPEPSAEALRTVLGTWIEQSAAHRGPMVGRMRDFRGRLEASSPQGAAAPAPGAEDEGSEPR
jgi:hypothetical protein